EDWSAAARASAPPKARQPVSPPSPRPIRTTREGWCKGRGSTSTCPALVTSALTAARPVRKAEISAAGSQESRDGVGTGQATTSAEPPSSIEIIYPPVAAESSPNTEPTIL